MEASSSQNSPPRSASELQEAIRRRAEEIYIQNGRVPGRDTQNWAQAESEIMAEAAGGKPRAAVVVKVNGVQYVGEYRPESSEGYVPGEFGTGSSVTVRLQGDRMFIRRPNGKILETRIVRKME
jgi:hypothetical protein